MLRIKGGQGRSPAELVLAVKGFAICCGIMLIAWLFVVLWIG